MFRIDAEFRALCPPLTKDEADGLRADVLKRGIISPLIAWGNPDDGDPTPILLDGHNRQGILLTNGKEIPHPHLLRFDSRREAAEWIIKNQMGRRNLTESQRAMMASKLANMKQGERTDLAQNCATSQSEAAEITNVSRRSVQHAAKVLKNGSHELVAAVEAGEVAVSAAAKVAELPKEEQVAVVMMVPAERAEAIKKINRTPDPTDNGKQPITKEEYTSETMAGLKRYWKQATKKEQQEFLKWVGKQ